MSYQLESKTDVLRLINETNGTTFTADQVVFGVPQVINGTWRGLANPHNTAVRVSADPSSEFEGYQVLTYDRFKLNDLAELEGFVVSADHPQTVHDLFDGMLYFNGLRLTADDVEDSVVTDNGNGTYSATLMAKATSLGWIGSLALTNFAQGAAPLDTALSGNDMPGLNYPEATDNAVFAALYLYGYDFTDLYSDLLDFEEDTLIDEFQGQTLVDFINGVDVSSGAGLWVAAVGTEWSVFNAKVVYNGINTAELKTNPSYKYVLMLELDASVTIPVGTLVIHYNDPVDSGSV